MPRTIPVLLSAAIALLVTLGTFWPAVGADAADGRPNIVIMRADDRGFSDLGCYGGDVWELYDLGADRSEMVDRSAEHPKRVAEMKAFWKELEATFRRQAGPP